MRVKVPLFEKEMPRKWYNLAADLPSPMNPPLGPNGKPISPDMLAPVFPMNLIEQEVSQERWIDIPEEILDLLYRWRPTPLHRATYLEQALGTPARIYYKNESVSPRRKPQAQHRRGAGVVQQAVRHQAHRHRDGRRPVGSALAFACALLGLECKVFMVRVSYDQKPYRKLMMQTWGAECVASPEHPDPGRDGYPRGAPRFAGQPRHRDQRGHRGRGHGALGHDPLRARQRAEPRAAAPDHHRPGGEEAAEEDRREEGRRGDRLRGRRQQLRWPRVPVRQRQDPRRPDRHHPRRAVLLPDDDQGALRLRPRRHGAHDPPAADALPRARLRAAADPRREACGTTAWHRSSPRRSSRGSSRPRRCTSSSPTAPRSSSRRPRGSSRLPRPATPSPRSSSRRSRRRRRGRKR